MADSAIASTTAVSAVDAPADGQPSEPFTVEDLPTLGTGPVANFQRAALETFLLAMTRLEGQGLLVDHVNQVATGSASPEAKEAFFATLRGLSAAFATPQA
jgi:hypothetical protein